MNLKNAKTYVYIDVSNIRYACSWSLRFKLDFVKLYAYLKKKYPGLQDVRYYEGVAKTDKKKQEHMRFLEKEIGYTICPLERKNYTTNAKYKDFRCRRCGFLNKIMILPRINKMKSNVDVYLTAEMVKCVALAKQPINIILLSCDGDYAEAIKTCISMNPSLRVIVLATPFTKVKNYLSKRLKDLKNELPKNNYELLNIGNIRDLISEDE